MIEQKELTKQQVLDLQVRCESFFINYKTTKAFSHVYNLLMTHFEHLYRREVWMIVTACSRLIRYSTAGVQLPLSCNTYRTANNIHNQGLSPRRASYVAKTLDELGYIDLFIGYYNSEDDYARTLFFPKPELLYLFGDKAKLCGDPRDIDSVEIRLHERLLPTKGVSGVKHVRQSVANYNRLLSKSNITFRGTSCVVQYKRVFSGDIVSGGRFYTKNGFQSIKSEDRVHIMLDGCKCSEVDISSMHPRILACISGIELEDNFDPYDISPVKVVGDVSLLRSLCKVALMCMLFNPSRRAAISAIVKKITEDYKSKTPEYSGLRFETGGFSEIIDLLCTHNAVISDYFFQKDLWKYLQYTDSRICEHIINRFVSCNKVCLCYHDSWIVKESDREFLIDCMIDAWTVVLGSSSNFKYKIDF